jgi:hypothetical protein
MTQKEMRANDKVAIAWHEGRTLRGRVMFTREESFGVSAGKVAVYIPEQAGLCGCGGRYDLDVARVTPLLRVTCPTTPGALVGCGTTFDAVPDSEGLFDCPECGLWFN